MSRIAKVVKSNSHVDYVARVIDELDADEPPSPEEYGFAQFVRLPASDTEDVIGVVYNTQLANPDYGSFGPRLSSHADLKVLSPDFLHEQGVLLGILLLGWRIARGVEGAALGGGWAGHHGVPRRVVPLGQEVFSLSAAEVFEFHRSEGGSVQIHYFSQALTHAGAFAVPLVESVIAQLEPACEPAERQRLCVLKKSLVWQRTLGQLRL
ncbi:MAG: hypothetical protein QOE46_2643 [Acidobacteriota bacterium]|jgi:hypothetical protein|nr:hypothetical protein [Acidobacteriota bacterium]